MKVAVIGAGTMGGFHAGLLGAMDGVDGLYVVDADAGRAEEVAARTGGRAATFEQAIEAAVYGLIVEGSVQGLWCFNAAAPDTETIVRSYFARRDDIDAKAVRLAQRPDGKPYVGACEVARVASRGPRPALAAVIAGTTPPGPTMVTRPSGASVPVAATPIPGSARTAVQPALQQGPSTAIPKPG